jgi:hypothetical protein
MGSPGGGEVSAVRFVLLPCWRLEDRLDRAPVSNTTACIDDNIDNTEGTPTTKNESTSMLRSKVVQNNLYPGFACHIFVFIAN